MSKTAFCLIVIILFLASCHESMERRATREAERYTRRNCPTPAINCSRTDSVVFEPNGRNFIYYCTFVDILDDAQMIARIREDISQSLYNDIASKTSLKRYVDAGFGFVYVIRSDEDPSLILFQDTIKINK